MSANKFNTRLNNFRFFVNLRKTFALGLGMLKWFVKICLREVCNNLDFLFAAIDCQLSKSVFSWSIVCVWCVDYYQLSDVFSFRQFKRCIALIVLKTRRSTILYKNWDQISFPLLSGCMQRSSSFLISCINICTKHQ